jgi:hypothetical protein
LTREDIAGGDYVPRQRDTKEAQEIEDKRISDNIDEYTKNNAEFIIALNIINLSFEKVARQIIEAGLKKELKFTVMKDRKKKEATIFHIKQSSRYDTENRVDIPLDQPIFRIKLPVEKKTGKIGSWNSYKDRFVPCVFDARKMNKKNGYKPVAAYVKKGKKKVALNRTNVTGFVTFKSLFSGTINFDSATVSKQGLSMGNKFYDMYIIRHKSVAVQETVSTNDISNMRSGMASDDEGSDVDLDEEENESVKLDNAENTNEPDPDQSDDDDGAYQDGPDDSDEGDELSDHDEGDDEGGDDEGEVQKPKSKGKSVPKKKK